MDLKIYLTFTPTSDGQWSIAKLPKGTPSELKKALNQELYCAFLPLRRKCGLILAPREEWQQWRKQLPPMPEKLFRMICEMQAFLLPQRGSLRLPTKLLVLGQIHDHGILVLRNGAMMLVHDPEYLCEEEEVNNRNS